MLFWSLDLFLVDHRRDSYFTAVSVSSLKLWIENNETDISAENEIDISAENELRGGKGVERRKGRASFEISLSHLQAKILNFNSSKSCSGLRMKVKPTI